MSSTYRSTTTLALTLAAFYLCGCKPLGDQAREDFSQEISCPGSKISVRAYDDAEAEELREKKYDSGPQPKPPREVAADPERLQVWEKNQEKQRRASTNRSSLDLFEVTGCGEKIVYECWRRKKYGLGESSVACTKFHQESPGQPLKPPSKQGIQEMKK